MVVKIPETLWGFLCFCPGFMKPGTCVNLEVVLQTGQSWVKPAWSTWRWTWPSRYTACVVMWAWFYRCRAFRYKSAVLENSYLTVRYINNFFKKKSSLLSFFSGGFFSQNVLGSSVIILLSCCKMKVTLIIMNQDRIVFRISTERQFQTDGIRLNSILLSVSVTSRISKK